MMHAKPNLSPVSMHGVPLSECVPSGALDSTATTRVKVVLLSQKGDRARTATSIIASDHDESAASTLRFSEMDVTPMNDGGDAEFHAWDCTTPFLEWHSAPLPAWLSLPGSVVAAMAASAVARDSVSIVVFQKRAAVVGSESDLFVGTLPHPLDGRIYTWPVVLGMRGAGAHGRVWFDMDAGACDAMLSVWLAADAVAPTRATHRCETDADSSTWSTDDEAGGGGDGGLVPSTTDDECNDGTSRTKRGGRTGPTASKRRRPSSGDSSRVGGPSSGRHSAKGRDSQPNTTDDDDDAVTRVPPRRARAVGRTRRRSTMSSDDDNNTRTRADSLEVGDVDDNDDNVDGEVDNHSGSGVAPSCRDAGGVARRRKSKAASGVGITARESRNDKYDRASLRRYARGDMFEEDSDGDTCAPDDDDDEVAEDDRCDDDINAGDREDDLNNDDDDAEIDDGDMDGDDDAADDTADCDVDDDLADDEDDLMDEDPNVE